MSMSVTTTVEGTPGGDCECWCLWVDEKEYRRIEGDRSWEMEKEIREDEYKMLLDSWGPDLNGNPDPRDKPWPIYPNNFIGHDGKKVRITVTVEDIDEA